MKKETTVFVLGILFILVPKLGIPNSWKEYFLLVGGALLVIIGYSLRKAAYLKSIENGYGERMTDSYVESHHEPNVHDPLEV